MINLKELVVFSHESVIGLWDFLLLYKRDDN